MINDIKLAGREIHRSSKTLAECDLISHSAVSFEHLVDGGSGLQPLSGYVELTDQECDLTCDDNPDEKRARMPCGCAIGL